MKFKNQAEYTIYRQNKENVMKEVYYINENSVDWLFWIKVLLGLLVMLGIFLLFWFRIIIVEFLWESESNIESTFFSILNGLIFGFYLNCLFGSNGSSTTYKIVFIAIFCLFFYLGIQNFGVRLTVDLPFLIEKTLSTNSSELIIFFTSNLVFFTSIYLMSYFIESEKE